MASTSAVLSTAALSTKKRSGDAFFNPLPVRPSRLVSKPMEKFQVRASLKEKAVTGLTAAAMTASLMVPDAAEAAVSPSLNNFLLSIGAGGVVAVAIVGAVIAVSNFDPVKRS